MSASSRLTEAVAAFRRGDLARARALAAAQVAAEHGPADAYHLLGLIECREGQLGEGIEHLWAAVDAQPDNSAFRVMLVRALVDAGRAAEALEAASAPRTVNPAALALWHARGEAAQAAGNAAAATEAWAIVSAARPDDWRAWANYGDALWAQGRWPEAAEAFKRAVELNTADPTLRRRLATSLSRAGQYQASADELLRWIEMGTSEPGDRVMLARLLADLGRLAESDGQLNRAAQLAMGETRSARDGTGLLGVAAPSRDGQRVVDALILKELAGLLERTNRLDTLRTLLADAASLGIDREQVGYPAAALALRDGDASEARRLLLADPPSRDPVRWYRLMARIAEAEGEFDEAFAAAEQMNRAVNDYASWRQRASQYLDWLRELAATLTPAWAVGLQTLDSGGRASPAFLVGFPRSGTTLLDTFLMGHSGTFVLEEAPLMSQAERVLGNILELPSRSLMELEEARSAYFSELDASVEPAVDGLAVDKMPLNLLALPYIHSLFPDARVVLSQRHPCDAVLSCFMQGFALNSAMACFLDIADAAAAYDAIMTVWTRSREVLPLRVHTTVYEQLIDDPERELRALIDFLGLDWQDQLLDHRKTALGRGAIGTPSYDQVVQPLRASSISRWKNYEKQLEPVLPVLLPWAERLGYVD